MISIGKTSRMALCLATLSVLAGCAQTGSPVIGNGNVSYGDSKGVELVSNEFGSTDLQRLAET